MTAATKVSTLGIGLVLTGTVLFWQDVAITFPVAAHIIGREAWSWGGLWKRDEDAKSCRKARRKSKNDG